MGDVVDRSWSAARVRGGAFSAGHRYGGVRAASAHYFSTHGSSRFGAEDAAMSSVCSRENWARKAERGVKKVQLSQNLHGGGGGGASVLRLMLCAAIWFRTYCKRLPVKKRQEANESGIV